MSDPEVALDLDFAIARRCHDAEQESLHVLLEDEQGGFFAAVIALLNRR